MHERRTDKHQTLCIKTQIKNILPMYYYAHQYIEAIGSDIRRSQTARIITEKLHELLDSLSRVSCYLVSSRAGLAQHL